MKDWIAGRVDLRNCVRKAGLSWSAAGRGGKTASLAESYPLALWVSCFCGGQEEAATTWRGLHSSDSRGILGAHLFINLVFLCFCFQSFLLSLCLCPSISQGPCLPLCMYLFFWLMVYLPVYVSVSSMFVCESVPSSIYLSVSPSVYLYIYLFI